MAFDKNCQQDIEEHIPHFEAPSGAPATLSLNLKQVGPLSASNFISPSNRVKRAEFDGISGLNQKIWL